MASRFFDNFLDELQARVEIADTLKRFIRGIEQGLGAGALDLTRRCRRRARIFPRARR